ncbi:MAG: response regulator, partial [Calditrichaeota bacterium]
MAEDRHIKSSPFPPEYPALFRRWLQEHPGMISAVSPDRWYGFFRRVISAIKKKGDQGVFAALEELLPRLWGRGLLPEQVEAAMNDLRTLLVDFLVNDTRLVPRHKSYLIRKTLTLFDGLQDHIREAYRRAERADTLTPLLSPAHLQGGEPSLPEEQRLHQLRVMAFCAHEDRFGTRGMVNGAFRRWTGIGEEEFPGKRGWEAVIHPDDFPKIRLKLEQVVENQDPFYELHYRMLTGGENWCHVVECGRIFYRRGKEVRAVAGIIRQAAPTHEKVDELPREELVNIFKFLLNDKTDFAFIVDASARLQYVTPALLSYVGENHNPAYTGKPIIGEVFFELLDDQNRLVAKSFWESVLRDSIPFKNLLLKLGSGEYRPQEIIEFTSYPQSRALGKPLHILWGRVVPRRAGMEHLMHRLEVAGNLFRQMTARNSVKSLYEHLPTTAEKLVPAAQVIQLWIRTPRGLVYYRSRGHDARQWRNRVILNPKDLAHLTALLPLEEGQPSVKMISGEAFYEALGPCLPAETRQWWIPDELDWIITGAVCAGRQVQALLILGTRKGQGQFLPVDQTFVELLVRYLSLNIERLILQRQLGASTTNFRALFYHSPIATGILQQHRLKMANLRLARLLGVPDGGPDAGNLLALIHPEDRGRVEQACRAATSSKGGITCEFRLCPGGHQPVFCHGAFAGIMYEGKPAVLLQIVEMPSWPMAEPLRVNGKSGEIPVLQPAEKAPPAAEQSSLRESPPPAPKAPFPPSPPEKPHALIVDDEPYLREVLVSLLELLGYNTLTAEDGQQALELVRTHGEALDLVVLDYALPDITGREVFDELRKQLPDLPVILCTG